MRPFQVRTFVILILAGASCAGIPALLAPEANSLLGALGGLLISVGVIGLVLAGIAKLVDIGLPRGD
jgi:hypothetical protein